MDQTLAVTAETVAAMPSTELVGAWVLLTRAIAEQALADPERLAPCSGDALPRTFDERHTRTFTLQAQLEDIAVAAQEVTRAADAVLHAVAVEHEDTVAQRAHLDEENYGLCERPPTAGEFAGDDLGNALGCSSATASRLAVDGRMLRDRAPALHELTLRGACRTMVAATLAREMAHLDDELAAEVLTDLVSGGAHHLSVDGARSRARKLLHDRRLAQTEADTVDPRREHGLWFTPHLDFDTLTEVRLIMATEDAARLRAAIEAHAQTLNDHAPDPRDELARWRAASHVSVAGSGTEPLGAVRVDALLDLVFANSTVNTVMHLKVPVHASPPAPSDRRFGTLEPPASLASVPNCGLDEGGLDEDGLGRPRQHAEAGPIGVITRPLDTLGAAHIPGLGHVDAAAVRRVAALVDTTFTIDLVDGAWTTLASCSTTYRPGARVARLVRERDVHCRFPHCTRVSTNCDLDHVVPHADGGPTSVGNLQALCRHHHRAKTFGGYAVTMTPDGVCTWESPTGRRWTTLPSGETVATTLAPAS